MELRMIGSLHNLKGISSRLLFPFCLVASAFLFNACARFVLPSAKDWISLDGLPSRAERIVAVDGNTIWVELNNGAFYTTFVSSNCESGPFCWSWKLVTEAPDESEALVPPLRGPDCSALETNQRTVNPADDIIECVYATTPAGETYWYSYFALISDGTIMFLDANRFGIPWIFTSP